MLELEKKESMGIKMMHWRIGELLRRRKQEKGEGGMHVLLENTILAIFSKTKKSIPVPTSKVLESCQFARIELTQIFTRFGQPLSKT